MDLREFQPFGASHWLAIAVTVAVGGWLLKWFRHPRTPVPAKFRMRVCMAVVLCTAVVMDPLLTGVRYAETPDLAWRLIRENSLPLYLCDVVSLLLAWALVSGRQRLAEVGYFWALAGTTQGLLTPTLYFDWKSPEYYAFFAQHGGAPVAAVVLVFGLGLAPTRGWFKRMLLWSGGYMAVVMALNVLLGVNYGFLNGKPAVPTLLDGMGPWPYYLITLNLVAVAVYLALGWLARWLTAKFPLPIQVQPPRSSS